MGKGAGRCSAAACGQSSRSSAVLMTQRLNLAHDINTAAAAQTLPGIAALRPGLSPLLRAAGVLASTGSPRRAAAVPIARCPHRPRLFRRYIRKKRTGVNRSCLAAFIFRPLFFLLWYGPQKDCFAIGKGSCNRETKKTQTETIKG